MKLSVLVGINLRKYRLSLKLSQESLAIKAKLHPNYISLLERGGANVSVDTIERICKILKVKPYELLKD